MTSRKRNKGKERKAKKAELEAELEAKKKRENAHDFWMGWSRTGGLLGGRTSACDHGLGIVISGDNNHPVITSFLDTFFVNSAANMTIPDNLRCVFNFNSHSQMWKNESSRNNVINIFIAIGTNLLLWNDTNKELFSEVASEIARAVVIFENYNTETGDFGSTINNRLVCSKAIKLHPSGSSSERDVLKFFRKRTACSCLKKMHLETRKTLPKLGMCNHCLEEAGRESLMVCSRCRIDQYCTRECQIAHWPEHKRDCDMYVKAQQKHTMNSGPYDADKTT